MDPCVSQKWVSKFTTQKQSCKGCAKTHTLKVTQVGFFIFYTPKKPEGVGVKGYSPPYSTLKI